MKNKIVLFIIGYIFVVFTSCLNSDNEIDYEISKDPQISKFSLSNDSIKGLNDVVFVIDQLKGLIYNRDSMAYGTVLDEKVLASISFTSGVSSVEMIPDATKESMTWTGSTENDSIDFSLPVSIKTTALDGITTKWYEARLNIHQVVPDTMIWNQLDENIIGYTMKEQKVIPFNYQGDDVYFMYVQSTTGTQQLLYAPKSRESFTWTQLELEMPSNVFLSQITWFDGYLWTVTEDKQVVISQDGQNWQYLENPISVKAILGTINPVKSGNVSDDHNDYLLACVTEEDGIYSYSRIMPAEDAEAPSWPIYKGNVADAGFPVFGFGRVSYNANYNAYLMIVAGKDVKGDMLASGWMTMDGLDWTRQTTYDYFSKRHGVMVTEYDDKFYLIGGIREDDSATKDIYYSPDRGVSWSPVDSYIVFPAGYRNRGYGSIMVDEDNYMFIFGGKERTNANILDEIWRGRINRLGFAD